MMRRRHAVDNDRCRGDLLPTEMHGRLVGIGEEHDRYSFRPDSRMGHSRQTFATVLHPQPIQINLCQFGMKVASAGNQ
jgi:hypothetical protein